MLTRRMLMNGAAAAMFGLGKSTPSRFPYPGRPVSSPGIGPSQGQVVRANTVIVFGPTGKVTGVFVYAAGTTPGAGNFPVAWISQATKDPYGNALPARTIVAYSASLGRMAAMDDGIVELSLSGWFNQAFIEAAGGPGVGAAMVFASGQKTSLDVAGQMELESSVASGLGVPRLSLADNVVLRSVGGTAANPTLITTDSPQAISVFSNGWSAIAGGSQFYELLSSGLVKLVLDVAPGTLTDGTTICNIPAPYRPATTTRVLTAGTRGGTAATNGPMVEILTSGSVQAFSMPAGTTQVHVNGDYAL